MMNPASPGDVENGTVSTPATNDHTDNFTLGDDSTLQAPPSDLDHHFDLEDEEAPDDDDPVHDLPSPEEYKAQMAFTTGSSRAGSSSFPSGAGHGADYDDQAPVHDLPTVEDYKSSRSFADSKAEQTKGRRQGLWTFLILFFLTAIVTAVAVPLALKAQDDDGSGSSSSASNANNPSPAGAPTLGGGFQPTPGTVPTPAAPVPVSVMSRSQRTVDYLVAVGVSARTELETTGTPQNRAANWIADEDEYQMDIPLDENAGTLTPHTRFTERYALAVLYFETIGASWKYQLRFLEPIDHCDWYQDFVTSSGNIVRQGVAECKTLGEGFTEELVHRLELSNNGLAGRLPSELSLLHRVTHLITPFNAGLTSNESFLAVRGLANLQHIEMQYCSLTGKVPDYLGDLRSLTSIGFGNNFLDGLLPQNFFQLTNLELLGLDDNGFTGPVSSFSSFSNMQSLYLEDNAFMGPLTEALISEWPSMVELDLSSNQLDGPIPANIWDMPNLEVLDLHDNDFIGFIPDIPSVHANLFFLALHDNNLDWVIPGSITNLPNLAHLDVSKNSLQLPFPTGMSEMTGLRYLFTGQNAFSEHPVPTWLAGMTTLREISMKDNNLTGTIPSFLGGLSRLQILDLDQNRLSGSIPEELGLLTGIDAIMLNRNNLNGTIPASFAILEDLDLLLLDGNDLTGNADVICNDATINITHFVADCAEPDPEITCSCCTLCCSDSNATCNNFDWHVNLDPIWEYGYRRVVYSFSQNLLPAGDD